MNVNLSDIEWAVEFASMGYGDHEAYLDTETGAIYYVGDAVEEPVPDDLFEHSKYLVLPNKRDLGLGKRLAISFVAETLPEHLDDVYEIFSRKGAYARFKALLHSLDKMDAWYAYEEQSLNKAIKDWCNLNSVKYNSDNS